ncbi:hypothetical protein GCG54_00013163, partial [Colletotrichum gloeosporioides]
NISYHTVSRNVALSPKLVILLTQPIAGTAATFRPERDGLLREGLYQVFTSPVSPFSPSGVFNASFPDYGFGSTSTTDGISEQRT